MKKARFLPLTLLCLSVLWSGGPAARGHDLSNSLVSLDFGRDVVTAELILPLAALEQARGATPAGQTEDAARRGYILARVRPTAPDGRAWTVAVTSLREDRTQARPDLVALLRMQPPPGASSRRFKFDYGVICAETPGHAALVSVRNDWNSATFAAEPKLLGAAQYLATSLSVDRTRGSFWRGFGAAVALGMRHIAEGLDHLLFLGALLLPAPLRAQGGHWGAFRGVRGSLGQLLRVVTAFTVGHSLTLLVGALGWVRLPERPVEMLIALSVLVSALHVLRPLFPGREPWVAGGFGLVHGLAFSGSVAGLGFTPWYLLMTVLGFNLGVEAMQLVVVLALTPPLLLLSRSGHYTPWRVAGGCAAVAAALVWMGERWQAG